MMMSVCREAIGFVSEKEQKRIRAKGNFFIYEDKGSIDKCMVSLN